MRPSQLEIGVMLIVNAMFPPIPVDFESQVIMLEDASEFLGLTEDQRCTVYGELEETVHKDMPTWQACSAIRTALTNCFGVLQ